MQWPLSISARRFSWGLVGTVFGARGWRLATDGYLGHMFELYSAWTWLPVFVPREPYRARRAATRPRTSSIASAVAFAAIAIGGPAACGVDGSADRRGREWLVTIALAASGDVQHPDRVHLRAALWVVAVSLACGASSSSPTRPSSVCWSPKAFLARRRHSADRSNVALAFCSTMVSIQLIPPLEQRRRLAMGVRHIGAGPGVRHRGHPAVSGRHAARPPGQPGLWVSTREPDRVTAAVRVICFVRLHAKTCRREQRPVFLGRQARVVEWVSSI